MKPSSFNTLVLAALLALVATLGAAYFLDERQARNANPPLTPPPSPRIYMSATERAPPAAEIQGAARRSDQLALEIERALVSRDPQQRETAFNVLLPELIQLEPERVVTMVARQEPGEARDLLRDEVARQWITRERDAAIAWMKSLEDEADRRASATIATRTLAASQPAQAIYVADQFGIGRDDGSLEHMVQIWATENLDEAMRWLETQPDDSRTAPLRARIEQVAQARNVAGE
jgi:hypothetical protein